MLMMQDDFRIIAVVIKKKGAMSQLRQDKERFYDGCCERLVRNILLTDSSMKEWTIIFDYRCKNKMLSNLFVARILAVIGSECNRLRKAAPSVHISFFDSQKSRGLQMIDFVVGAIQRKYEYNDLTFYGIISERIVSEEKHFFD